MPPSPESPSTPQPNRESHSQSDGIDTPQMLSPIYSDTVMDLDPPTTQHLDDHPSTKQAPKYPDPFHKVPYAGAAQVLESNGQTFMDQLKSDLYAEERGSNLYYPFASREEWELALFLLRSKLSMGAIDVFLKIELITKLGLSFKTAKDLRNRAEELPSGPEWKSRNIPPAVPTKNKLTLFYRDSVDCVKALLISPLLHDHIDFTPFKLYDTAIRMMRVYTEWLSGDAAHFMQEMLPPGSTLVAPVLSTDKTTISSMTGNRIAHPCLLSLANISMDVRNKASNHLYILLALIPIPKYIARKGICGMLEARLYHECLDIIVEPLKKCAQAGLIMSDPVGNLRRCYTPLAAFIVDTPESALIAGVAGKTSSVTLASQKTFGDDFRHLPRTRKRTLQDLADIEKKVPNPWHLETYKSEAAKYRLNGVHRPFWRDWHLSDPSIFLTPEPLHHWHKMFWDHDAKWCIKAVGSAELDFRFTILQHRTGYRHFKEGISSLKQVTGREHRDMQRYIVALIVDAVSVDFVIAIRSLLDFRYLAQSRVIDESMCTQIEAALKLFHDHKHAIMEAGARSGKGGKAIDNWYIPKLEFLQSVVPSIKLNGNAIQWSADYTEHAHIEVVKEPTDFSNNQNYEPQVCRHLDRIDKLQNFDLATAIEEAGIDFRRPSPGQSGYDSDSDSIGQPDTFVPKKTLGSDRFGTDTYLVDTTSELLDMIDPITPFSRAGKSDKIVDYFHRANLLENGIIGPNAFPSRTHESTKNVAFHLTRDPSYKRLPIDTVASIFHIPDLKPALAHYIARVSAVSGQSGSEDVKHIDSIGGRRYASDSHTLEYKYLEVWHKVRIQSNAYHYPHDILPPVTINAFPPSAKIPHGYFDSAIVNLDASKQWPHSGLQGHSVVDVRIIFRVVPTRLASSNITGRFLTYVQRFDVVPQPQSRGSSIRGSYPEPSTGMYRLTRTKRENGVLKGDILPLDQVRALADVIPHMGSAAPRGLTTNNSHSLSTEFRLNKFFDKEMYLALSSS